MDTKEPKKVAIEFPEYCDTQEWHFSSSRMLHFYKNLYVETYQLFVVI